MKTDAILANRSKHALPIAIALWIITSGVGFWLMPEILNLALRVYAAFWAEYGFYGRDYWGGVFIRQILLMPIGALYLITVVGCSEYYARNYGQPGSWKVFARVIAVEVTLIVLTAML